MRMLILLVISVCLSGALPAGAAPAGKISEAQAAAIAQERFIGEVIDVELDDADKGEPGNRVFEVRLLTPAGDVISVRISAEDGRYLGAEAPDLSRAQRSPSAGAPTR